MNKLIILLVVSVLAGAGIVYTNTSQQQETGSTPKRVTKESQRERGRTVFKGFGNSLPKLSIMASVATSEEVGTEIGVGLPMLSPSDPPVNFKEILKGLSCSSDAIVIGTVKEQTSRLTEDDTFIYTDNVISIEEVIKNNLEAPIQASDRILISRIGGKIRLNGKNVTARHDAILPLELNQPHLLFLSYIPERGVYVANSANGSFLLKKNKIINLTKPVVGKEFQSGNDATIFTNEIRSSAAATCDAETQRGTK
ncbi:MAG: hypothetical protein QOH25_2101 [Acidobacteriota bacterium]|jgi:hypothetical protein|nr:hypothetical protein [Acidobacteriota bacterium]